MATNGRTGFLFLFSNLPDVFLYVPYVSPLLCTVFISVLDLFSLSPDLGILLNPPDPILIRIQARIIWGVFWAARIRIPNPDPLTQLNPDPQQFISLSSLRVLCIPVRFLTIFYLAPYACLFYNISLLF
jgi:hypothetical protein